MNKFESPALRLRKYEWRITVNAFGCVIFQSRIAGSEDWCPAMKGLGPDIPKKARAMVNTYRKDIFGVVRESDRWIYE